jgi:HSP20 family molecular chaperone IbpA
MAFFPRNFYTSANDTSFTPLFRLLDDFDTYSRQGNHARRSAIPHWQPKFDVRETGEAYELHGELPGVSKDNVQIEFTEPQSMLVRGKVERTYTAGTPPTGAVGSTPTGSDAAIEASVESPQKDTNSHKATVEDGDDKADTQSHESGFEEIVTKKAEAPKKQTDNAKYWLTERSIGEFSRSFNFPSRVDQDSVTASFNDGILSVIVPKAKKHETRRINVN